MDAYFASIEQRDFPIYRGKPVIVCHTDDANSLRGVVSAASYEARPYGIKSGISVFEAKRKLKEAVYLVGNYEKYLYNTKKILEICKRYSDIVEVFSVDELFIDAEKTKNIFGGTIRIGLEIKNAIEKELGLSSSIGIGPNKLTAKMASEFHKPGGFTVIFPEDLPGILAPLPVDKLVGVGERMKRHLDMIGVKTIGDLSKVSVDYLKKKFGVIGVALHYASLGKDGARVYSRQAGLEIKSFGHSSALGKGISDMDELSRLLLGLTEGVTRRMRKEKYYGRTITLRLCLARMFSISRSKTGDFFTQETKDVFPVARELLKKEKSNIKRYPPTLIGVSVSNLVNVKDGYQLSIFDFIERKDRDLTKALDSIKDKFGERAIFRASLGGWKRRYHSVPRLEIAK